ncbi:MAG TPA: PadR family transcriptional regulator, partial [Thermoanaerobaculia bacterium]
WESAYRPFPTEEDTMGRNHGDLLQGTLGLLILKALTGSERHGYGIARWIEEVTGAVLQIEEGSLYPALRRLEDRGLVEARWGLSENNRRARFYAITPAGRTHLQADASLWRRFAGAVFLVLEAEPALG